MYVDRVKNAMFGEVAFEASCSVSDTLVIGRMSLSWSARRFAWMFPGLKGLS